MKASFNMDAYT